MNATNLLYAPVRDPLNILRSASNETTLISEIPNIIIEEIISLHKGKEKYQFQF